MSKSLTIVLPVHNHELKLRAQVEQLLELAIELTDNFHVLIVDDGSTDDTFEVASVLAVRYPQVSVTRHAIQRGLGPTVDAIRKRVKSDMVIVHDGVSTIDAKQVRRMWDQCQQSATGMPIASQQQALPNVSDLADVSKTHAALEEVQRRMAGFQLMPSLAQATISSEEPMECEESISMVHQHKPQRDDDGAVGSIPPLPRPNFLQVLSQFALGE